jgi:CO dehydrogenase/acetyl-CoA synthase beta subunit
MGLFNSQFDEIRAFLSKNRNQTIRKKVIDDENLIWPSGEKRNVVLKQDMAVELGNPMNESASFILWTNNEKKIRHRWITVMGPGLSECDGMSIPFGQVILVGGTNFNEENYYSRYRTLENTKYDLDLKGFMRRAVSQYQREWSRISRAALKNGFSFEILGSAFIRRFLKIEYISSVELVFITSGKQDVQVLRKTAETVGKITRAMSKMAEELSFDCSTCEYAEVCRDVEALRKMRKRIKSRNRG